MIPPAKDKVIEFTRDTNGVGLIQFLNNNRHDITNLLSEGTKQTIKEKEGVSTFEDLTPNQIITSVLYDSQVIITPERVIQLPGFYAYASSQLDRSSGEFLGGFTHIHPDGNSIPAIGDAYEEESFDVNVVLTNERAYTFSRLDRARFNNFDTLLEDENTAIQFILINYLFGDSSSSHANLMQYLAGRSEHQDIDYARAHGAIAYPSTIGRYGRESFDLTRMAQNWFRRSTLDLLGFYQQAMQAYNPSTGTYTVNGVEGSIELLEEVYDNYVQEYEGQLKKIDNIPTSPTTQTPTTQTPTTQTPTTQTPTPQQEHSSESDYSYSPKTKKAVEQGDAQLAQQNYAAAARSYEEAIKANRQHWTERIKETSDISEMGRLDAQSGIHHKPLKEKHKKAILLKLGSKKGKTVLFHGVSDISNVGEEGIRPALSYGRTMQGGRGLYTTSYPIYVTDNYATGDNPAVIAAVVDSSLVGTVDVDEVYRVYDQRMGNVISTGMQPVSSQEELETLERVISELSDNKPVVRLTNSLGEGQGYDEYLIKDLNALTGTQMLDTQFNPTGRIVKFDQEAFEEINEGKPAETQQSPITTPPQQQTHSQLPDMSNNLVQVGPSEGSQPGGWFQAQDGTRYYVKFAHTSQNTIRDDQLRAEFVSNQVYQRLGIAVPQVQLATIGGKLATVSQEVHNLRSVEEEELKSNKQVNLGFLADAFLANWDVAASNNMQIDADGNVFRLDQGGTLNSRARGEPKQFTEDIPEIETLVEHNPVVFSQVKTADTREMASRINGLSDEDLQQIVESAQYTSEES